VHNAIRKRMRLTIPLLQAMVLFSYAIILCVGLVVAFWMQNSIKTQVYAFELDKLMAAIQSGPVWSAARNDSELAQLFLDETMDNWTRSKEGFVHQVTIRGGLSKNVYAKWATSTRVLMQCQRSETRAMHHKTAYAPFYVSVAWNGCANVKFADSILWRMHLTFTATILLVLFLLGAMLVFFMQQVKRTAEMLPNPNTQEKETADAANSIVVSELREVASAVLSSRAGNTLVIKHAFAVFEHELSRVQREIEASSNYGFIKTKMQELFSISDTFRGTVSQSGNTRNICAKTTVAIKAIDLANKIENHFFQTNFTCTLLGEIEDSVIQIPRGFADGVAGNLASNLRKYGGNKSRAALTITADSLLIESFNKLSTAKAASFWLAHWHGRIHLGASSKAVYEKLFGREGYGLRIVRDLCHNNGGQFFFGIVAGNTARVAAQIPIQTNLSIHESSEKCFAASVPENFSCKTTPHAGDAESLQNLAMGPRTLGLFRDTGLLSVARNHGIKSMHLSEAMNISLLTDVGVVVTDMEDFDFGGLPDSAEVYCRRNEAALLEFFSHRNQK